MAADVESSQASSKAYPSVAEPSAPDYGAYREQQYGESCGLEGASEHQAFYGYRATADDYNSEYSWSQRGPSSDHESAEERYEHTTSSEPRRASRSADISPEAAVRALLYHGACYTVQCIRRAGTWVGIKLCNHIERRLVAKRQRRVARDEASNRLALRLVDGALQQTRRIHDWLAVRNL
ncbi:hypothetical protein Pmar_PMAR005301 [Perkinsus marinus ATCC 50983]|uniref:Uncharacterized protein n=1 Tax=Perkinsus marinus (strain ATCC 50983 / TXsc) TaxID=423536 RepID=C5KB64_PERM5|nr:hypothetical protein Pmar_PMAR005301 [Perkinsus marinus ATCC 50983]EER18390.1 hypothetical protein Pmar_PMAR005301 [Perkinsus marinus ATCC 50983]|eukprot:XP_002786594.1 hypothetical protein Pmar_PMAR005301 [Perkinsus marinus ATCC 50983]